MNTLEFGEVNLYSFFKYNDIDYYKDSDTTAVQCLSLLVGPAVEHPIWTGREKIDIFCKTESVETGLQTICTAMGTMHFNEFGKLHNETGPAFTSNHLGMTEFFYNGVLHRADGPASITRYGELYYIYGKRIHNPMEYWIYVEKNS